MESLTNAYKVDILQLSIYEFVIPIIEKYEGKEITKRLATEIKKVLGDDFYVVYDPDKYGWRRISIYDQSILKYDNSINLDFTPPLQYGELSKIKTWTESVLDTLNQAKARRDYIKEDIKTLKHEMEWFTDIESQYKEICKNTEKGIKDLLHDWGTKKEYYGDEKTLSYELKKHLESINNIIKL